VNRYEEAALKFLQKPAAELPWTTKIELPGVMELITVDAVTAKLDELLALPPEVRLQ
jgi:heptosyltransferase I